MLNNMFINKRVIISAMANDNIMGVIGLFINSDDLFIYINDDNDITRAIPIDNLIIIKEYENGDEGEFEEIDSFDFGESNGNTELQ